MLILKRNEHFINQFSIFGLTANMKIIRTLLSNSSTNDESIVHEMHLFNRT